MKLPIIADNHGDVLIFETLEGAQSYLEPIDVSNNEYIVYDGEGRLLKALVKRVKHRERTVIQEEEENPDHQDELKKVLITFLSKVTPSKQEELCSAPLDKLVQRMLAFKTK